MCGKVKVPTYRGDTWGTRPCRGDLEPRRKMTVGAPCAEKSRAPGEEPVAWGTRQGRAVRGWNTSRPRLLLRDSGWPSAVPSPNSYKAAKTWGWMTVRVTRHVNVAVRSNDGAKDELFSAGNGDVFNRSRLLIPAVWRQCCPAIKNQLIDS